MSLVIDALVRDEESLKSDDDKRQVEKAPSDVEVVLYLALYLKAGVMDVLQGLGRKKVSVNVDNVIRPNMEKVIDPTGTIDGKRRHKRKPTANRYRY